MKFLGVQSYKKRVVSHCFFDFYLEKRKKKLTFAPEIVKTTSPDVGIGRQVGLKHRC